MLPKRSMHCVLSVAWHCFKFWLFSYILFCSSTYYDNMWMRYNKSQICVNRSDIYNSFSPISYGSDDIWICIGASKLSLRLNSLAAGFCFWKRCRLCGNGRLWQTNDDIYAYLLDAIIMWRPYCKGYIQRLFCSSCYHYFKTRRRSRYWICCHGHNNGKWQSFTNSDK